MYVFQQISINARALLYNKKKKNRHQYKNTETPCHFYITNQIYV